MANDFLNICAWNIEALSGKLGNPDFMSKIPNFDLVALVEKWLPYIHDNIAIQVISPSRNVQKTYNKYHAEAQVE